MWRISLTAAVVFVSAIQLPCSAYSQQSDRLESKNTQQLEIPFTPPGEALEMLRLPPGFQATLFAAEPDVHQPIAVTTDERGRLWVVECYTYSDGRTNYDLSMRDRVIIFEDKNNDGKFDQRTVFWDQGQKLTGIELGFGGVWLTAAPNLIFIPDRNRDDQPDGPPEILLDGFEDDVIRHNIVNGLRWGPDGWLYGRHGIQATSHVGAPGSTESQRTPMNCAIWRFHPKYRKFEIVAEGGTNSWGFDYDQHGEMFMINTVIGHLFHVVPGARYDRMYGSHFNPHTYSPIEQTADHVHWDQGEVWNDAKKGELSSGTDRAGGGHAHTGLMIYQGGGFPGEYHNTLFTANFHGRRLNNDTIHRVGNSYVGRHTNDFLKSDDPWFRGIEMIYGPSGGIFVLDWSDIGECHENDGIHRTSGRIFKITYGDSANHVSPSRKPIEPQWLSHPNEWFPRHARRHYQELAYADALPDRESFVQFLKSKCSLHLDSNQQGNEKVHLRQLWTLYAIGGADVEFLLMQTRAADEHVRAWAVRFLADGLIPLERHSIDRFVEMANESDSTGLVRLYLASALGRLKTPDRFRLVRALTQSTRLQADANDRVQPKLIWFGLEPVVMEDISKSIKLMQETGFASLRQNIARRIVSDIDSNPLASAALFDAIRRMEHSPQIEEALTGASLALEGFAGVQAPGNWNQTDEFLRKIDHPRIAELRNQISVIFGDGRSIAELKQLALDEKKDVAIRRTAIKSWTQTKPDDLFVTLKKLVGNKALTTQVVRSMVHCDEPNAANVILNRFPHMDPEGRAVAINTLTSRIPWSISLLDAIEKGRVQPTAVTAWHARKMRSFDDGQLNLRLAQVWGEIRDTPVDMANKIAGLRTSLSQTDNSADPGRGRLVFKENCASCHTLFGVGGTTGPDLTGANRNNLNYLLENIVDPSASVAETYRSSIIRLEDGQLINGLIINETDRVIRVQTPDEIVSIDKLRIEERKTTDKSVMPDGVLDRLSKSQTNDLFSYLRAESQIPFPENEPDN